MIPDLRTALFLRMAEILGGHAYLLEAESERKALGDEWHEIAPEVVREVREIRETEKENTP